MAGPERAQAAATTSASTCSSRKQAATQSTTRSSKIFNSSGNMQSVSGTTGPCNKNFRAEVDNVVDAVAAVASDSSY